MADAEFEETILGPVPADGVAKWAEHCDPTTEIDTREFLRSLVEDVDREMAGDLGGCAYYLRCMGVEGYEDGICSYGCREEPECVTCEPEGGWPSIRPDFDYRKAWADEFVETLLANAVVKIDLGVGR